MEHELLNSEIIYSGKLLKLVVDEIVVSGKRTIREVVRHPGGVVILAVRQDGQIPFVRQPRYPLGGSLLELPAGKLDLAEDPARCAARELEEEVGFKPEKLEKVMEFYSTPGFCDELLTFYYAPAIRKGTAATEFDEQIQVEWYSLDRALRLIREGGIKDLKTIAALYWLERKESGR